VARGLPLEITFKGPEKAVRAFLSSIAKPDGYYIVIRSLRITNEKKGPPRTADAKFDKPAGAKPGAAKDPFGEFFTPDAEPTPAPAPGATPAPGAAPAPAPAPAPPIADNRILSQVLGDEQLQVFIRLDLMQFLPAKKLP